jgi:hypothetical protein
LMRTGPWSKRPQACRPYRMVSASVSPDIVQSSQGILRPWCSWLLSRRPQSCNQDSALGHCRRAEVPYPNKTVAPCSMASLVCFWRALSALWRVAGLRLPNPSLANPTSISAR